MAGGSNYLTGQTGLYGLPATLPAGLGEQASATIDAYLKRPEGLVYVKDANGFPAYMKGLTPTFTYTTTTAMSAGAGVLVTVQPANIRPDIVGEVFIVDKGNAGTMEAVVVQSIVPPNQLMLQNVQFSHGSGVTLDMGLTLSEERNMPSKRSIARYTRFPCVSILSLMGRYAYGRRSDQVGGLYQEMNLLAAVQTFGGPPQWIPIPINQCSWNDATGEIWVPAGMLLAYYSDIKIKYVAGFTATNIPDDIIRATAQVAQAMISSGQYGPSVKTVAAGNARIERFQSSYMDSDTKTLLERYRARLFY